MRPDPRCPSCSEKVSATATWCMHCGGDFDEPVDARDGTVTVQREREVAVDAATRDASSADAGHEEGARTPDAVEAARHHESGTEPPGLVESVTGGESADSLLAPLFAFLDRGEWRRLAVVAGICLALAALAAGWTLRE